MTNELIIHNLSKTYKNGVKALDGVSLRLSNGMFGLLGPNGAGKSSLMRSIAALQSPDEGSIHFNQADILSEPDFIRKELGYLPQEFGVYPRISALELLDHFAILKGIVDKKARRSQVDALLEQTNLYKDRKKAVSSFSGGMRQRFGIAQALLGSPKLIIVDEPTAGLDPEERYRFHNLLSEIGEQVIVILSTHIVEDVRDLCSRMAIMAEGKLIQVGSPDDLIAALNGKIWRKTIEKSALPEYKESFSLLSSRFFRGKIRIHIYEEENPENGFELLPPDLSDVYFHELQVLKGKEGHHAA
ncbi:MAG: ABC transporter ATP-binding protein [Bacteroidia bacterium]|nr:ABC transporter ATP-binding protein [Bacteroidia bacterium]